MKIIVGQHKLEIVKEPVNEREIDISKCEFEFDEAITSEYVKEAYFTLEGNTYKQIILNDECDIPSEVLVKKGTVEIGVVAFLVENEEEIKRYNPSPAYFNTWVGSLKDNAENSEPVTPTDKEQMEQALQDGLNSIDDKLGEVDDKMLVVDGKIEDIDTAITQTNNLNIDVSDKVGKDVTVTLTKKDGTEKSVVISDGNSLEFMWQGTSLGIKTDDMEQYVFVNLQGIQGQPGPQGEPFRIKKEYASVAEMNADFDNMNVGDYVMIASTVEIEDNAKLYVKGDSQWIFITDFSGAQGIKGETGATPIIRIGTVTSGSTPSVTISGTAEEPVFNFVLQPGEKGEKGDTGLKGDTGNGIASIAKTSSAGLIDTYTITFTDGTTSTFNITNGQDGEVTQEYVDEQDDQLRTLFNVLPKVSDSGESIELENTGDTMLYKLDLKGNTSQEVIQGEVGLEEEDTSIYVDDVNEDKENYITLKGNTYQYSTSGKNLLQRATGKTKNGITFTILDDNSVKVSGTATANVSLNFSTNATGDAINIPAGTYVLSGCPSGGSSSTYKLATNIADITSNDYGSGVTITADTEQTSKALWITIYSGTTCNNLIFKPMLRLSNTTDDYEPYTGSNPSPSPDYPQDIQVVSGDNSIKVEGKNLFDKSSIEEGKRVGGDGLPFDDTSFDLSDYIKVDSNTQYTYSRGSNGSGSSAIAYYDSSKTFISRTMPIMDSNARKVVLTTPNNATYVRIADLKTTLDSMQLEKGTTATTYTPYVSQTYPINLGDIELCKIGTYQDRIYKNNGNWYLHKEVGKVVLDGTNNVFATKSGQQGNTYTFNTPNFIAGPELDVVPSLLSNKFISRSWNKRNDYLDNAIMFLYKTTSVLNFRFGTSSSLTTLELANAWLVNNNVTFYGILLTPTETQITDTTLISQLNALYNATIYSTTHINTETSNLLPYIDLKYNVVTASPSPDRASEVEVVKGNNTITISNEDGTKTQTYNITLGNLELCKIGDYQDYFYKDNGNWYKYGAIAKTTDVVGSTSITINNMVNNGGIYSFYGGTLSGKTITYDSALLRQNTIYYPLATPTQNQITDQLLVSQLDELQKAMSYYDKTIITQTNADKPFILDIVAIRDLQDIFNL